MANRTVSVLLKAEIGQYVSSMAKAATATEAVGKSAETTGSKFKKSFDIAGKGAMLLGVGVAGALVGIVTKSMEFEKAMSAVGAATMATSGTMTQLRAAAIKAGADTMYSATEAANGITEMAKAGVSAKDIMGGGLTGALSLAAAGQIDVADAAGIASTAMTQFNLKGAQIPHVADLLAAGAGKAMGSVGDLGMALNQAGLVASSAGLSIEETTGTLAAFASAGLLGSDAGTSLKTMLQKLQAPSIQAAGVMKQYGINVYDANGNMLSMAGMAAQLKDHLGGLTQEQRNSALATIFGTDAVRAATVLYNQGASGIDSWTKKVNDQGYAAKQAAALTDNLSGDLERLGGSFDTLLISLGSGAQGPLRAVVEALTGILNVLGSVATGFGSLPGPVQAAVVGFGVLAALGGPLGSLFTRLGLWLLSTVTGFGVATGATSGFTLAMAAARISIAKLVTTAAPLAGLIAVGYAITDVVRFTHAGDDARKTVDALHDSLKGLNNADTMDTAAQGIESLKKKIASAQALIDKANNESFIHHTVIGQFTSIDSDAHNATEAIRAYKRELADLESQQTRTNTTADTLSKTMGLSRDEVIKLADKYGINLADGVATAQLQFAEFNAGQSTLAGVITATTPARDILLGQLSDISSAADDAKKSTDLFKLSLDILTGKTVDTATVEAAFYDAVSKADGALKGLHGSTLTATGSLNVQTEAGRKAQGVLFDIRDANNQVIATMIQNGATTAQVTAKDAELRESFIKSAMQMGISRAAAEKLATQILGIPKDRNTKITADTKAASKAIDDVQTKINGLTGKTLVIKAEYLQTNGLGSMPGRHTMTASFAEGGYTGHGGKYEPKGVVHGGEYVFTKEETAKAGVGTLASYAKSLRGYADGGPVGVTVNFTQALDAVQRMANSVAVGPAAGSGVQRWLPVVLQSLAMMGQPSSLAQTVLRRMQQESGGNPTIVNRWDSNWAKGTPSVGGMQVIGPTYRAYADPRRDVGPYLYGVSTDMLSNLLASEHYALARYGSLSAAYNKAGGYANGGTTPAKSPFWVGENGPELMWSDRQQYVTTAARSREMSGRSGGAVAGSSGGTPNVTVNARVFIGDREITDIARVEARAVVNGRLEDLHRKKTYR